MPLTEDQIERKVERHMDYLDRLFIAGEMTQREYDMAVQSLDIWAERKLAEVR